MAETPVPETRAEMVGLVAAAREEALRMKYDIIRFL
mgnify:CR=1 FL=1